jgi:hypothetical protein
VSITVPPASPAVKFTDNCALSVLIDEIVGALGTVRGVDPDDGVEYDPVPAMFTAATRKTYSVPFTKPVTVAARCESVPSAKVVQVVPPLDEY